MDIVYSDIANGIRSDTFVDKDGTIGVRRSQDVEEIIKAVHREKMETNGHVVEGMGRHIGEVPITALIDYCQAKGIRWEQVVYGEGMNHVLKDFLRENAAFRTTDAKF
ncbi:MAG: hypothetical protein V4657_01215 [Pseudomonadota bacterium]